MKSFTTIQWVIIVILSMLTALEPLSIDLYLPAFLLIADDFTVPVADVQTSLTTFLGGFALGQLFWGPIADRFGRKKPILLSLIIFILASVVCIYVRTMEQLWMMRFIQALGGCGGIVISRAVVTDYFDKTQTLKIFTILALIMSVAPIIAPVIGTGIVSSFGWKGVFAAMVLLGIMMFLLTVFFLPETNKNPVSDNKDNMIIKYVQVLRVRQFTFYALVAGIANGALMVYVANAPFLIMDFGQLPPSGFTIVFSTNALGLMIASYLTTALQKYCTTRKLITYSLITMMLASIFLLGLIWMQAGIYVILGVLFFFVFPIGVIFPATTELAMSPFTNNSGTASALFGSIQLLVAFICMLIGNLIIDGTVLSVGFAFFSCGLLAIFPVIVRSFRITLPFFYNQP